MTELDHYIASLNARIADFMAKNGLSKSSFGEKVSNDKLLNSLADGGIRLSSLRNIERTMAEHRPEKQPKAKQPASPKPAHLKHKRFKGAK